MTAPGDVSVREAHAEDTDAIVGVTLAAYGEYAPALGSLWETYRANIVSTLTDVRSGERLVAEREGRVVGSVLLLPARRRPGAEDAPAANGRRPTARVPGGGDARMVDAPEVRLLAVAPTHRGAGIGRALMQECVRRARVAGARRLTLHTTGLMRVARAMYERMGFVRDPALDFHPAPGLTIEGYVLALDPPARDAAPG
jgi:GNAT superfamily N-acetyltransferase